MTESLAGRWLRRYKLYFLLGLLILIIQIFLAYLLPIFGATDDIVSSPQLSDPQKDTRKQRNSQLVDDEDNSNSNIYSKPKMSKDGTDANKKYQLRLDELSFIPSCDIVTKEAVSAIHRAKTQECKENLVNITCAIQNRIFYANALPNYCPNEHYVANRSLGCFKDEKNFRILSGYYTNFKLLNTPAKCIQMCLQSGFLYAGVQYSSECFCGNTEPAVEAKLPDPECNYKCIGDSKQMCGGYFTINVYETGISKFLPQVAELMPKDGEKKVKIAFLLTLNGRAVRQVHRLLKSLYSKTHFYYIHVDARQDYMYRELLKLEAHTDNIRLAKKRFSTIWGGASLLKMLLTSMRELLHYNWQWDFVINLSESDFLVKTTDKLVDFLTANKNRNFVKSHGREVQRFIQKQGLDKTFVECDTHMWRIGDRELPNGIQIDGGSDWIALSRNFVEYVTNEQPDDLIKGLLTIFHHTLLPAESFFHTALRNSKYCNTYVDNNLHVTNWKRRLGCKCQYKHVVDWCGCSPNDFKPDDWPRLLATEAKQLFFARKFEPIINQAIILKLEEWLYGPYPSDFLNLHNYWQSIYNREDIAQKPDDALLTVATSLARIKSKSNFEFKYEVKTIKEVHTFMENDVYRGFLIYYEISTESYGNFDLELWTRPQQISQTTRSSAIGKRIRHLEVSTEFDQKEQISRNFAKILGPYSEPIIVMHLSASELDNPINYNMTILWVNPVGKLADISDLHVEDTGSISIHFAKSNIKLPLLPGAWMAKIIHKKTVIAQCKFLISPLESTKDKQNTFDELNGIDLGSNWNSFLPTKEESDVLEQKAMINLKHLGPELLQWIDNLIDRFFIIKDICIVNKLRTNNISLQLCNRTSWSSFASDPKSDIYSDIQKV